MTSPAHLSSYPSRRDGVLLSRSEAFELCEVLAAAERSLVRAGRERAASGLASAFELIEDRLFGPRTGADHIVGEGSAAL